MRTTNVNTIIVIDNNTTVLTPVITRAEMMRDHLKLNHQAPMASRCTKRNKGAK